MAAAQTPDMNRAVAADVVTAKGVLVTGAAEAAARVDDARYADFVPTKLWQSTTRTCARSRVSLLKGAKSCRAVRPAIAPGINANWPSQSSGRA